MYPESPNCIKSKSSGKSGRNFGDLYWCSAGKKKRTRVQKYFTRFQMDFYDILGVSQDANATSIKSSYKKLALQWHPVSVHVEFSHTGSYPTLPVSLLNREGGG